jgi:hypothetical protein
MIHTLVRSAIAHKVPCIFQFKALIHHGVPSEEKTGHRLSQHDFLGLLPSPGDVLRLSRSHS